MLASQYEIPKGRYLISVARTDLLLKKKNLGGAEEIKPGINRAKGL